MGQSCCLPTGWLHKSFWIATGRQGQAARGVIRPPDRRLRYDWRVLRGVAGQRRPRSRRRLRSGARQAGPALSAAGGLGADPRAWVIVQASSLLPLRADQLEAEDALG